jgi:hypothetical protein
LILTNIIILINSFGINVFDLLLKIITILIKIALFRCILGVVVENLLMLFLRGGVFGGFGIEWVSNWTDFKKASSSFKKYRSIFLHSTPIKSQKFKISAN